MATRNLYKLEKLRIDAYKAEGRLKADFVDGMDVMFNPVSLQEKHKVAFQAAQLQAPNSPGRPACYSYTPPPDLSLKLIFDGTGVAFMGDEQAQRASRGESVKKDIAQLKKLCLQMNGEAHQPNFLKVSWGDFKFPCRLASLDITYELFDESGDPLRANLEVSFVQDRSERAILLEANKSSPDLTHVRMVKGGDTLPLLCKDIYGSSVHYLRVAAENGLDNFRLLQPGQKLRFPPLT